MITLVYDGACPFCSAYIHKQHIEAIYGPLILLDARSADPRVMAYWQQGYPLDAGMLLDHDGLILFGAEALARLAELEHSATGSLGLNLILQRKDLAKLLYPIFKIMRRIALFVRGTGPLRQPPIKEAIKHKAG